ncbi:YraN family protein [Nocardioides sp. GY 10113]|uniref:YraN family protein n=1 Tax=Nocardioides sp. GY 10113 TaxID=2569761 RepID=UPI0010A85BB5|nr:YraN family protein [Nocardioides sp. GY 10113]TIC88143.1 YraN family protein [Nocardioides sp. GY 10113]
MTDAVDIGSGADRPSPGRVPDRRRQALGAYGEDVAARHLTAAGLVLLDRNWRCAEGEIDLVLRAGRTLVVCEVKTRSSLASGTPHEAITDAKLDRLKRLGERWVEEHGIRPDGIRIDLVAVLRPRRGPAVVDHVAGLL